MAKPKVISFIRADKIDNIFLNTAIIGRPADIFIQCASYDLKIPINIRESRTLDIFEETILRMLSVKKCTVSELADVMCLEKDLVNFVLIRLQEKGLLEDKFTISEAGKQELGHHKELRDEVEYMTAKLFIVSGRDLMLPYIFVGDFISEDIVEFSPSNITLGFGSIGNQRRVGGTCIREKTSGSKMAILPTMTVRNAIKKYNKLAKKRKKQSIVLADEYAIESSRGEDIYFHMQMAVQAGNIDELIVSDGFVSNIDGLFAYIKKLDPDLVMRVQGRAVQMSADSTSEEENHTIIYTGKYQEVVKYCRDMDKNIRVVSDDSSLDDIKQKNEDKRQAAINCYSMLEWAFYYHALKYPMSDTLLQLFKSQKTYENFETIKKLAGRIGINNLDEYNMLFSSFDGRQAELIYRNPSRITPTMQAALSMAIISASEHQESELKQLLSLDQRFLSFIYELGSVAGDLRHDSSATIDDIKIEEMSSHAIRIIRTILPDITLSRDGVPEFNHVSNERLKATVGCEKALGSLLYNSLDEGLQADFRKISPDKSAEQLPDPYEYVQVLYRILQTTFFEESKGLTKSRSLSKEDSINKIESLIGIKLPKTITTVKEARFNAAKRGMKATLGAQFLALFPCLDEESVKLLNEHDVVSLVDKVLEYRKHANDISLMVSNEELGRMRECVINTLKILGGYYHD